MHFLTTAIANKTLLILVITTLFCVPVLPAMVHRITYSLLFTGIILTGTQLISRSRKTLFAYALVAILLVWIGDMNQLHIIIGLSKGFNVVLYIFIVTDLVRQVSRAKMVSPKVIVEAINGYLMIGLVFSIVVGFMSSVNPGSFSFDAINSGGALVHETPFHEYIYYAFITLTTVGYGDVVPLTAAARSVAILISVTGQLYIAVVIAVLVGKYISQESRSETQSK